jgi:hypothetical protein
MPPLELPHTNVLTPLYETFDADTNGKGIRLSERQRIESIRALDTIRKEHENH